MRFIENTYRTVDVEGDIFFRIFVGQVQKLGHENIGNFIIYALSKKQNSVLQKTTDNVHLAAIGINDWHSYRVGRRFVIRVLTTRIDLKLKITKRRSGFGWEHYTPAQSATALLSRTSEAQSSALAWSSRRPPRGTHLRLRFIGHHGPLGLDRALDNGLFPVEGNIGSVGRKSIACQRQHEKSGYYLVHHGRENECGSDPMLQKDCRSCLIILTENQSRCNSRPRLPRGNNTYVSYTPQDNFLWYLIRNQRKYFGQVR